MRELNTIGRYFRSKFGCKVYKVPVSISGFTCPNIDGTVATGGCSFCENESFSPNLAHTKSKFKLSPSTSSNPYLQLQLNQLELQFYATKVRLEKKFKAQKFIVYFQSFTNTYAPLETLQALYEKALSLENVVGLSIGTRTDCITEEILDYLVLLQEKGFEIWVEYGVQTIFDETLQIINRGHDFANMEYWIAKTKEKNLKVCAHLIFGLPNETQEMMLATTQKMVSLKIDSIKFHPLYVVQNTLLTIDYLNGEFEPISQKDYIEIVVKSILLLDNQIIIQRTTAGISNNTLLAPQWCYDKNTLINAIRTELKKYQFIY